MLYQLTNLLRNSYPVISLLLELSYLVLKIVFTSLENKGLKQIAIANKN